MARIIVRLRNDFVRQDGKKSVLLHIHMNDRKIVLPTNIAVHPDKWDNERLVIKGNSKEVKDDNLVISHCRSRVNDIIVRYRLQNKQLTPQLLRYEYQNPAIFLDFIEFCEKQLQAKKGIAEVNTIRAHTSAIEKLKAFRQPLMFAEINDELIQEFYKHMRVTLKNKNSTSGKTLRTIHHYLNLAVRKKIISENPFPRDLEIKRSAVNRVFLLPEEFTKLVDVYRRNHLQENYQRTLRYFLFSCCVGLRISDVKAVTWNNISDDVIMYSPVKTKSRGKIVRVPLANFARELLGPAPDERNQPLFECYTDQVTNRYLKDIADLTGIDKKITSHTGRHTFATLYLRHSKNIAGLKELMGHSNIAQTMVYAHIIYEDLKTDIGVFDILSVRKSSGPR